MNATCPSLSVDRLMLFQSFAFLLCGLAALFSNGLLVFLLKKTILIPGNVRLLLSSAFLGHMVTDLFYFQLTIYICLAAFLPQGFGSMRLDASSCGLLAICHPIGGLIADVMIAAIGVERLIIYLRYNFIEQNDRSTPLGRTLVLGAWLVAVVAAIFPSLFLVPKRQLCFCHILLAWPEEIAWIICVAAFLVPVGGLVLFCLGFVFARSHYNKFGLNLAHSSLGRRFELAVSMRTTRALWPTLALLSAITLFMMATWLWLQGRLREAETTAGVNLFLAFHFPMIAYLIVSPIIVLARHRNLQKTLRDQCPTLYATLMSAPLFRELIFMREFANEHELSSYSVVPIVDYHVSSIQAENIVRMHWYRQASLQS